MPSQEKRDELVEKIISSFNMDPEVWKCLMFIASIAESFSLKLKSGPITLEVGKRYDGRVEVSYSVKEVDGTERIIKKVY